MSNTPDPNCPCTVWSVKGTVSMAGKKLTKNDIVQDFMKIRFTRRNDAVMIRGTDGKTFFVIPQSRDQKGSPCSDDLCKPVIRVKLGNRGVN